MPVKSSVEGSTASEKVSCRNPIFRSNQNETSTGWVVSTVNVTTCIALEGGIGSTRDPLTSCIVFAVRDRKVLPVEVATSVDALIPSVSLAASRSAITELIVTLEDAA